MLNSVAAGTDFLSLGCGNAEQIRTTQGYLHSRGIVHRDLKPGSLETLLHISSLSPLDVSW